MPVSESRKKANAKWDAQNLDRMSIALPRGTKEQIREHVAVMGDKSTNACISRAIIETIQRDTATIQGGK